MKPTGPGCLISAIIPAYNAAGFVGPAIESVLRQTYPSIECIVVDDGSTDRTSQVASRYARENVTVHVVHQSNQGVLVARNRGADAASGQLLAFLDADDVWLPEKTELQVRALERTPQAALVYGGYRRVDQALRPLATVAAPDVREAFRNTLLLKAPSITLITAGLVRADVFDSVGGFDPGLSTSADLDLVLRIARCHPVARVAEPVALYRQSAGQMSSDIGLMERDMNRVFSKFFRSAPPDEFTECHRQAYARLFFILGTSHLRQGHLLRASTKFAQATIRSPTGVLSMLQQVNKAAPKI